MYKLLRALVIAGVATGALAFVLNALSRGQEVSPGTRPSPEGDPEAMTEAEQQMLLQELDAHLSL